MRLEESMVWRTDYHPGTASDIFPMHALPPKGFTSSRINMEICVQVLERSNVDRRQNLKANIVLSKPTASNI